MSHLSPSVYLMWTLLMLTLASFLVFHLWHFDRFKCLRWNSGPSNGAFKRVMTYSYIATIPAIATYTIGYVVIKYQEGYSYIPGHGVIPTPYLFWKESSQKAIFPLTLTFAFGWALEMVTHLEELCFWLFLVNAGHAGHDWFRSLYFKAWVGGSIFAVLYMPLVAILTRHDPLRSEACVVLAGSFGSLALTLWFTPILFTFPKFLKGLKREGVDMNTVVRLTKFHELNTVRVVFRYLFAVPFVMLGLDGIQGTKHPLNESPLWTDLLGFTAALGVAISSAITLVIFFPRNIEGEINTKQASKDQRRTRRGETTTFQSTTDMLGVRTVQSFAPPAPITEYDEEEEEVKEAPEGTAYGSPYAPSTVLYSPGKDGPYGGSVVGEPPSYRHKHVELALPPTSAQPNHNLLSPAPSVKTVAKFSPNRRLTDDQGGGVEMGSIGITEDRLNRHNMRQSNVNHLVYNFTSPIDLMSASARPTRYAGARAV